MDNPMPTVETAERVTAMQDIIGRNLPPAGTYAHAGAEQPPAPPADYATVADIERQEGHYRELLSVMRELLDVAAAPTAAPLSERLKSRRLLVFIAGLLTTVAGAVTTATQTSVDGSVTWVGLVTAITVQVAAYVAAQSHEDAARQHAQGQVESARVMAARHPPTGGG